VTDFALIGAAGFVAPRHMRAIKETGGNLVAALDPADNVGVMDSYFPDARFFTEFERFDRHVDKLRRMGSGVGFVSICSPNYLHDAHARFALRSDADAICEKPLVLNPWNLDGIEDLERQTGKRVYTILQLRHHPAIIDLKAKVENAPADHVFDIDLTYITSRGRWYFVSWKGDDAKGGGIATNIGIHFFDMLSFVFGRVQTSAVHLRSDSRAAGFLELERARVRWFLSVDRASLPAGLAPHQSTFRSITVDGQEIEFSGGFNDLHTESYKSIVSGNGFGIGEARPSIELVSRIRSDDIDPAAGERHFMVNEGT